MEGNSNDSKGSNNGSDTSITYDPSYGKFGQGALFNASTDKISIGAASDLNFGTGDFSVNMWVNATSATNGMHFVGRNTIEAGRSSWYIRLNSSAIQWFDATNGTTYTTTSTTGTDFLDTGVWQMCTFVRTGGNFIFYKNGALYESKSGTARDHTNVTDPLCIGSQNSGNAAFQGDIDDVSFFTRALTVAEIIYLYNTGGNMDLTSKSW
jgi:hypothetical protein